MMFVAVINELLLCLLLFCYIDNTRQVYQTYQHSNKHYSSITGAHTQQLQSITPSDHTALTTSTNILTITTITMSSITQTPPNPRLNEFWIHSLATIGWIVHQRYHPVIGQDFPYAVAVNEVELRSDRNFVYHEHKGYEMVVSAADLRRCVEPTDASPRIGEDGIIYQLHQLEHDVPYDVDYDTLPCGMYRLEIFVPLFHVVPIEYEEWRGDEQWFWAAQGTPFCRGLMDEMNNCMGVGVSQHVPSGLYMWEIHDEDLAELHAFERSMRLKYARLYGAAGPSSPGLTNDVGYDADYSPQDGFDGEASEASSCTLGEVGSGSETCSVPALSRKRKREVADDVAFPAKMARL